MFGTIADVDPMPLERNSEARGRCHIILKRAVDAATVAVEKVEKIVEKIVEVEKIVYVEKIVEVEKIVYIEVEKIAEIEKHEAPDAESVPESVVVLPPCTQFDEDSQTQMGESPQQDVYRYLSLHG